MNHDSRLSFQTRKALSVQIGEKPAAELIELIQRMAMQIEELKRTKVNVTRVVPANSNASNVFDVVELDH